MKTRSVCEVKGCPTRPYKQSRYCALHKGMELAAQRELSTSFSVTPDFGDASDEVTESEGELIERIEELRDEIRAEQIRRAENPPSWLSYSAEGIIISDSEIEHMKAVCDLGSSINDRITDRMKAEGVYEDRDKAFSERDEIYGNAVRKVKEDYQASLEELKERRSGGETKEEKMVRYLEYNNSLDAWSKNYKKAQKEVLADFSFERTPSGKEFIAKKARIVTEELSRFREMGGMTGTIKGSTAKGKDRLESMNGLIPTEMIESLPPVRAKSLSGASRDFYTHDKAKGEHVIALNSSLDGRAAAVHEFGHFIEVHSPEIQSASLAYLMSKARPDKGMAPRYKGEKGAAFLVPESEDKEFSSPYVGKLYSQGLGANKKFNVTSTEVFSVGMERLYSSQDKRSDARAEYDRDQQHMNLVLGLLATAKTQALR